MIEAEQFFEWLSRNKLSPNQMLKFTLSMGDFCTRTRSDLGLVAEEIRFLSCLEHVRSLKNIWKDYETNVRTMNRALLYRGDTLLKYLLVEPSVPHALEWQIELQRADRLDEIGASEQKHACDYAVFVTELLRRVDHPLVDQLVADMSTCERLFQSLGGVDEPEVLEADTWVRELACVSYVPVFDSRRDEGRSFYAIGGIRAVEELAENDIIPGWIKAIGPDSVYGIDIETHPNLGYIRDHLVAEEWHHSFMDEMYQSLTGIRREEADCGYADAQRLFASWFSYLLAEFNVCKTEPSFLCRTDH